MNWKMWASKPYPVNAGHWARATGSRAVFDRLTNEVHLFGARLYGTYRAPVAVSDLSDPLSCANVWTKLFMHRRVKKSNPRSRRNASTRDGSALQNRGVLW